MKADPLFRLAGMLPDHIEVVDDRIAEILRKKSPAERLQIGFSLWESARDFLRAHLASIHPDWDETEIEREISRRFLDAAS